MRLGWIHFTGYPPSKFVKRRSFFSDRPMSALNKNLFCQNEKPTHYQNIQCAILMSPWFATLAYTHQESVALFPSLHRKICIRFARKAWKPCFTKYSRYYVEKEWTSSQTNRLYIGLLLEKIPHFSVFRWLGAPLTLFKIYTYTKPSLILTFHWFNIVTNGKHVIVTVITIVSQNAGRLFQSIS